MKKDQDVNTNWLLSLQKHPPPPPPLQYSEIFSGNEASAAFQAEPIPISANNDWLLRDGWNGRGKSGRNAVRPLCLRRSLILLTLSLTGPAGGKTNTADIPVHVHTVPLQRSHADGLHRPHRFGRSGSDSDPHSSTAPRCV